MKDKQNTGKKRGEKKEIYWSGNNNLGRGVGGWGQKAYPLCHLGKERGWWGGGLLEIS